MRVNVREANEPHSKGEDFQKVTKPPWGKIILMQTLSFTLQKDS